MDKIMTTETEDLEKSLGNKLYNQLNKFVSEQQPEKKGDSIELVQLAEIKVDPQQPLWPKLKDVECNLEVVFGNTKISLERLVGLSKGEVIALNNLSGEDLEIRLNDKLVGRGEMVVVNNHYGVRITELLNSR